MHSDAAQAVKALYAKIDRNTSADDALKITQAILNIESAVNIEEHREAK